MDKLIAWAIKIIRVLTISLDGLTSAPARKKIIKQIATALEEDALIVGPIAQGYAFIASGKSEFAMSRIKEIKGIEPQTPLVRLVANYEQVESLCGALTSEQIRLLERHWPGPLIAERETLSDLRYSFGSRKLPDSIFFTQAAHPLLIGVCKEVGPLAFSPIMVESVTQQVRTVLSNLVDLPESLTEFLQIAIAGDNSWSQAKSTLISLPGVEVVIMKIGDIGEAAIREIVPRVRFES